MHKAFLLGLFVSALSFAKISVNVPPSHPAYTLIDRLESWGCALTTYRATGPQAFHELSASLLLPEGVECSAPEILLKEREWFVQPKLPTRATLTLLVAKETLPLIGLESEIHPLHPLHQGRITYGGVNLYGEISLGADGGKDWGFAASITPGFLFALDDYRFFDARYYIHEGYIKVGYKRAEILYGRQSLTFGDAKHGGLALSQAAKPLDLVKFSLRPHVWPSILGFLGPATFETWIAGLGDSRFINKARMWGIQLGMRPFTFLEFALLEMYQFGGTGISGLEFSDYLKMLFYSDNPNLASKRRESLATHLGIWGPSKIVKLYQQFFVNRLGPFNQWLTNDLGFLLGVWFPRVGQGEIRVEYVHTPWGLYNHSLYRQGWSNEYAPLGSPLGSDGEGIYLDFGLPAIKDLRPTLLFSYESRNRNPFPGTMTEWRYSAGGKVEKRWDQVEFSLELQDQFVNNYQYRGGESQNLFGVFSNFVYSFQ